MKSYKEYQEVLQEEITSLSFGNNPDNLYEPIRYILKLGGKRLRPTLVLLTHQLRENDHKRALYPAIATEVFHNFTLMHDDIMDGAPLRRGQPTVHEKWGQTVAILSGDTMLVKAYDLLLHSESTLIPRLIRRFNQTATEVCEGQQIDMNFETMNSVPEKNYIEMIRLKTGALLGFCTELGGILADFDDTQVRLLYEMGESMGIGFQLMDDYLDVYGDQNKFGKQVGGDIISNKKTYLLINALEMADGSQSSSLQEWMNQDQFDPQEKVGAVTKIYNEIGIDRLTKNKMDEYFQNCYSILNQIDAEEGAKQPLREFIDRVIHRES